MTTNCGHILINIQRGSYSVSRANTPAENNFQDVKPKDIVKQAIKSIKWVLRIAQHMGSLGVRKFKDVQFEEADAQEVMVGLENESHYCTKELKVLCTFLLGHRHRSKQPV